MTTAYFITISLFALKKEPRTRDSFYAEHISPIYQYCASAVTQPM